MGLAQKQTHTDQIEKARSREPEINPQICGRLIYDKKKQRTYNGEKILSSVNGVEKF